MNPTPDLNQRYLSGLPTQNGHMAGYPVPSNESQPVRVKVNLSKTLLTVAGVVGLILLVFYVTLIYPLVKTLRNAKENPSEEAKPLTADAQTESSDPETTAEEVNEEEEEIPEDSIIVPGSPRR